LKEDKAVHGEQLPNGSHTSLARKKRKGEGTEWAGVERRGSGPAKGENGPCTSFLYLFLFYLRSLISNSLQIQNPSFEFYILQISELIL
jgi:hypothetical protein